jgi:hypothetical protein
MFGRYPAKWTVIAALTAGMALSTSACGGGKEPGVAQVKAGEMPAGGDWTGVYYDPVYGYLHLVQDGNTVNGAWRTTAGDEWGEMGGESDGNLFRYKWTQHRIGMVGPSANKSGKGYFVYRVPDQKESHVIEGERGNGDDETGEKWKGIKQTNLAPDPKSVRPDEIEGHMNAGGWDTEGGGTPAEGGEDSGGSGDSDKDSGDKDKDKDKGSDSDPLPQP